MTKSAHVESHAFAWLVVLFFALAVSGFVSYFLPHHVFNQINSLLHLVFGSLWALLIVPYSFVHFKRILGVRRSMVFVSGLLTLAVMLTVVFTGMELVYQGQREDNSSTYQWHFFSAISIVLFLVIHILLHFVTHRSQANKRFQTSYYIPSVFASVALSSIIAGSLLWWTDKTTEQPYSTAAIVENYQYNYGPHPFRPSQTDTTNNIFIDEKALATTDKCASCHMDIAKQWYRSAHRQAASDKTYVTNVTLLATKKGIEATRYCEGCHAPLALLTGQLSEGGEHAGIVGSLANVEGVNCQSCHGISKLVHNKGVASYHFDINQPYIFETAQQPMLQQLNRLAMRFNPAQHKQDMAPALLGTAEYCSACHSQFIDKDLNGWGWIKMQDEYTAWLDSPYSGNNDPKFSHAQQQRCQDCHMPLVKSDDPSASKDGYVRSHEFFAANSMLTTLSKDYQGQQAIAQFMQSNKVRISIEPPHRKDATINKMPVNPNLRHAAVQPYYFYKGESASIKVIVANTGVGHNFPGGTIDINQAWVAVQVVDAEGHAIFNSGDVDEAGYLEQTAYQYRSLPTDRQGQIVWKHDLFNMVGKASVNVIRAGESDVIDYQFKIPYWAKSPISISTQINYRKLNTRYAKWAMKELYQPLPIIELSRAHLAVPLRDKLETIDNLTKLAESTTARR
ncbi:multiheme c-type cytochrome [Catenovulum agarivorans]|uniref:multiheme c-type cytochrome n=1 Tax=Catenovulum agarivorans TaxID=1172192 RepID=UPI0002FB3B2B|nr:multiheme c-type cytochrome [Catenovulum agarivorans]